MPQPTPVSYTHLLRRPLCIVISLLFIVAVIALVFVLVIPELAKAFTVLGSAVPSTINSVIAWAQQHSSGLPMVQEWLENLSIDWNAMGKSLLDFISTGAGTLLGGTVQVVSSTVSGLSLIHI